MTRSVFNTEKNLDFTKQPMFFGKSLQVQRYDNMKYPIFDKLCQRQLGYFWRPEEISLQKALEIIKRDFENIRIRGVFNIGETETGASFF